MRPLLASLSIVVLTACATAEPPASGPSEAEPAPTQGPTDVSGPASEAAEGAVILQSDGLGVLTDGDSIDQFPFESDEQTVLTVLEESLGSPTGDEQLDECGAGPLRAVSWEGFSVYFTDTGFGGWYLQEPAPTPLSTAQGVTLGSTLEELEAAFGDVTVDETTIGTEWLGGDISGILSEDAPTGEVEVMWAGANCIAR